MYPDSFCQSAYAASLREFLSHRHVSKKLKKFIRAIMSIDLAPVDQLLAETYSKFGPRPYAPSSMLIACLLAAFLKVPSITDWVERLRSDVLYARICGWRDCRNVPAVGTFYNFATRLWALDSPNIRPHVRPKKDMPKAPHGKNKKADTPEEGKVAGEIAKWRNSSLPVGQPYIRLLRIFQLFLQHSVDEGLIDAQNLFLAGDGTPVKTSARGREHRVCDCRERGITHCECDRYYSQPDSFWGWDSSRNCYYNGYNLYLLTAAESHSDLPVFPLLLPDSRHDSLAFVETFALFRRLFPQMHTKKLALDSAHDAMPLYHFFLDEGIQAFVDLNKRSTLTDWHNIKLDENGRPRCPAGLPMHSDGCEKSRLRMKFRCPKLQHCKGQGGKKVICNCDQKCTDSDYGPVVHLPMRENPRMFCQPTRGSKGWVKEYKRRTSAERDNKRIKIDYKLEDGHHRSSKLWYCRLYVILMLEHLVAWQHTASLQAPLADEAISA